MVSADLPVQQALVPMVLPVQTGATPAGPLALAAQVPMALPAQEAQVPTALPVPTGLALAAAPAQETVRIISCFLPDRPF